MKFSSLREATKFMGRVEFSSGCKCDDFGNMKKYPKAGSCHARFLKQRTLNDSLFHKLPNGVISQINGAD
jgi:hypothetical protein